MSAERYTLLDGRVHVYRRENSRFWQCAIYLRGRNHRASTHQDRLDAALTVAREWALDRIAEDRLGSHSLRLNAAMAALPQPAPSSATAKTFKQAAEAFLAEYRVLTAGERNPRYVENKERHLKLYLLPFFGKRPVSEVTAGLIQQYRVARLGNTGGKRPARSTLHQETVTLRQVLKSANRHGWIAAVPDMSAPYKTSGKIAHRAWFSPEEYERLRAATDERARSPKRDRWRAECELFHDFVEFMANTGLRPDEAQRLEFRDVEIVMDGPTRQRILEIDVRGKRGVGFCKSTPDAVEPFERLLKRRGVPKPTDLIFGKIQRQLMNAVLDELGLKTDRDGNPRTAYSLRHTYICFRLLEGADIYQVAKNCRTSVEMIEKFYASHIKTRLDAAALNGRPQSRKAPSASKAPVNT
ncbi:tyrosine-type recombinase/integrase [Phenylobacterium soli]|uniref:Site-specific integrase n=1 Tax=Phenylobacterium soli TaxID=2170551 RepID=A0A328AHT2_9CAUL|nr:site-specific integrase [Phenylobacterium soli]RAK54077.1 site-specific integrase [Phenylobacterium soli]